MAKRRREYTDETKAAVMAALLSGQSVTHVAREYKVPVGTVRSWRSRMANPEPVASEKREAIGDLLVEYVEANLRTLKEQSEVFRNRLWLEKQDASQLAVLHGVIADKTVRLLEALGGGDGDDAP